MEESERLEFWNSDSFADWLRKNCPPDLIVAPGIGVTVAMLAAKFDELAFQEWSNAIDARGEDA